LNQQLLNYVNSTAHNGVLRFYHTRAEFKVAFQHLIALSLGADARRVKIFNPNETRHTIFGRVRFVVNEAAEGLLGWQRKNENEFDPAVKLSQSSNNVKSIIDPESKDEYGVSDSSNAWIEIRLWKPLTIHGIRIRSTWDCPGSVHIIDNSSFPSHILANASTTELNDADSSRSISFAPTAISSLLIRQTGAKCHGSNDFGVNSIELMSPLPEYSAGVFQTLYKNHRETIQKFVRVRAFHFDLEDMPLLSPFSPQTPALTNAGDHEWVQIEIVNRSFMMTGYRLGFHSLWRLRHWSVRGSNNQSMPLSEWTVIDVQEEATKGDFGDMKIFDAISFPFRYFRIVQEGTTWEGKQQLILWHFELFGSLYRPKRL
jgi:hypothetical protein